MATVAIFGSGIAPIIVPEASLGTVLDRVAEFTGAVASDIRSRYSVRVNGAPATEDVVVREDDFVTLVPHINAG